MDRQLIGLSEKVKAEEHARAIEKTLLYGDPRVALTAEREAEIRLEGVPRMSGRVLADRHQADLFQAMQLLFADRLGFDVYTPVGHDWWDDEIWAFGKVFGDDRLARQYLAIDARYEQTRPGVWRTFDTAHPSRPIFCAGLDWARATGGWEYVVATVQENQRGFHRFAQEVGARFVVQVGNTGQRIEWDLDPLVISSSEMPILGRGVVAHQEFESGDGGAFAFADPAVADRRMVRSFMNLLHRVPRSWADFTWAEDALAPDGFTFESYGHEGRDGLIQPTAAIATMMGSAGWGWHDKPVGDGFGHVIHGWAAAGRPLIGHGSFYRGKLAEPFWDDLVTCIDLDKHGMEEVVSLIRDISGDPARHAGMCEALRARFDDAVDYERDETAIRQLLGL